MNNNFLGNGAVLPAGLLNESTYSRIEGFNKTYKDTPLRAGVVVTSFSVDDPENRTKLATEYDVVTTQQTEDRGGTTILYRKCLSGDALGGIADFFEFNFRQKTQQDYVGQTVRFNGQNGSIVLLLCLDATSNKAIIIGGFPHPDRPTTLTDTQPRLSGEYNGVAVAVNPDGSTSLTFKGATNSDGNPIDPSQGNTVFQIKTDGSFEFNHSTIDIKADRSGVLTINAKSDININTQANANINVTGNTKILTQGTADIIAQGTTTVDGSTIKLGVNAVESVIKGNTFAALYDSHVHIGNLGFPTGAPLEPMDPSLSTHTFTE